jgi:hypothetical protein
MVGKPTAHCNSGRIIEEIDRKLEYTGNECCPIVSPYYYY